MKHKSYLKLFNFFFSEYKLYQFSNFLMLQKPIEIHLPFKASVDQSIKYDKLWELSPLRDILPADTCYKSLVSK